MYTILVTINQALKGEHDMTKAEKQALKARINDLVTVKGVSRCRKKGLIFYMILKNGYWMLRKACE